MQQGSFISRATILAVGLTCKAFLSLGFCSSVTVNGFHHLQEALESEDRKNGKGIITVANHISVLDDPTVWGTLPTRYYLDSRYMRWALGASDIMFTNPTFSKFFNYGQVLETFRGQGIYQKAVDVAVEKVNEGGWVHLFGEGKVNQTKQYPVQEKDDVALATLPRFKWGTGRVIMEARHMPLVIPMWLTGFDDVMPEDRTWPRFLPRLGKNLSITFGAPLNPAKLDAVLQTWKSRALHDAPREQAETATGPVPLGDEDEEKCRVRSELTAVIQREIEELGYSVSGPLLGRKVS